MKKKLFCEISPFTYWISLQKEIVLRHVKNLRGRERFAHRYEKERLPVVVSRQVSHMIKVGTGIDPRLQRNKAANIRLACSKMDGLIIAPGETFSFWNRVGKTSRRNGFSEGRVLVNGKLVAGIGGGLCNLANTINLLVLHSPLTITELHHHSDALAPDPDGKHVPYGAGTSVNYNFIDYRFRNDTAQPVQLCLWCEREDLYAELRTVRDFPCTYRLTEEDHHFHREADGKYYRLSRIFRETLDRATGETVRKELVWDNRSEVLFDTGFIPESQIR
jgi:vancomycin resistance protein VanW